MPYNSPREAPPPLAAGPLFSVLFRALLFSLGSGGGAVAACGGGGGAGGFDRFVRFINKLADFMIPVGAAFSVLGLIWGGMLFQAGDQRAGRVLGLVALGVGIVLMSKPIAA